MYAFYNYSYDVINLETIISFLQRLNYSNYIILKFLVNFPDIIQTKSWRDILFLSFKELIFKCYIFIHRAFSIFNRTYLYYYYMLSTTRSGSLYKWQKTTRFLTFLSCVFRKLPCDKARQRVRGNNTIGKKYNNEAPLNVNEPFEAVNGTDERQKRVSERL